MKNIITLVLTMLLMLSGCLGISPIASAVYDNDMDNFKKEIQKNGGINTRDETRKLPIHYAVQTCNKEMIVYLLNNGADVNDGLDEALFYYGIFKNHWAQANNRLKCVEFLLQKGGDKVNYLYVGVDDEPKEFTDLVNKYEIQNEQNRFAIEEKKRQDIALTKKMKEEKLSKEKLEKEQFAKKQREDLLLETLLALKNNTLNTVQISSKEQIKNQYNSLKSLYTFNNILKNIMTHSHW